MRKFYTYLSEPGMGSCPGILRDPGPGPANPRDWDRDGDSKPRDSRDQDKSLRDSPETKSRISGQESRTIPLCPAKQGWVRKLHIDGFLCTVGPGPGPGQKSTGRVGPG